MSSLYKKRLGSFSKSGVGSKELNELMLRYVQSNQISNFMGCIIKGADIDYRDGAALQTAVYMQYEKLTKAVLACEPVQGLQKAREIAEKLPNEKILIYINEYCNRTGLGQ